MEYDFSLDEYMNNMKNLPSVLYLFGKQTQEALWQAFLLRENVG